MSFPTFAGISCHFLQSSLLDQSKCAVIICIATAELGSSGIVANCASLDPQGQYIKCFYETWAIPNVMSKNGSIGCFWFAFLFLQVRLNIS